MEMLEDHKLKDNEMYVKMTHHLSAFYLQTEEIRINGKLSAWQEEEVKKSGFSYAYKVKLFKCLRDLLIHIVNEKMMDVKLRQLRQTYTWFIGKLTAMGALSEQAQADEAEFLNPTTNMVAKAMKEVIKQKVYSALCNEESVDQFNKAMYENKRVVYDEELNENVVIDDPSQAQRTHHPEIQPAATRI